MTIIITDGFRLSGASSVCPFCKVLRVLLAHIILGSDYSGSVKEVQRLLMSVLRKVSLKKSLKKKKKKKKKKERPKNLSIVFS